MGLEGEVPENPFHEDYVALANDNPNVIPASANIVEDDKNRSMVRLEFHITEASEFADGKKRAMCKHGQKRTFIADTRYGTSHKEKHLEKCKSSQAVRTSQGTRGESRFDQKVYRELVAKSIIRHGYGFSWVEHQGNSEIQTYLNNQVTTISRNIAESDCLKLHAKLKEQLKDILLSLPGRICLTCDLWTSCQTERYLCLTAHYVDSNWKLNSKVLNFCHLGPPYTGSILYGIVFDLLQDWGIEHKLFSMTLDNASSDDRMQDYLKFKLIDNRLLLSSGDYFHIQCAAPTLNHIVKDCLKAIDDCLVKIRESVKYIKGSEARKMLFQRCVKRAMIDETEALWLDVPTRWDSTYFMLDRALLYRRAFRELYRIDPLYMSFLTEDEWERIARIHELLAPFYDITDLFSGSDYPTANLYFEHLWKIDMFIKDQLQSRDQVIKDMVVQMRAKFDKYWSDYTLLFAFALILDPRCKLPFLKFCYEKLYGDQERAYFKVHEVCFKLEMLLKEYTNCTNPPSIVSSALSSSTVQESLGSLPRKRKFNYSAEFDENEGTCGMGKTMLDVYLEDPKIERRKELDILTFWKSNQERYGELSLLARDVLSIPLTTVASDFTFSIGGRILNKWKNSYISENVEALITTRSWLYGFESDGEQEFTGSYVDWTGTKSTRFSMD